MEEGEAGGTDGFGEFWTVPLRLNGDRLFLNFDAKTPGYVKVGIEGLENRGVDDCDPLTGNHFKQPVTWKGQASMGIPKDAPVSLRFQMRSAKLFSFEIR